MAGAAEDAERMGLLSCRELGVPENRRKAGGDFAVAVAFNGIFGGYEEDFAAGFERLKNLFV